MSGLCRFSIVLLVTVGQVSSLCAQVLREAENDPNAPLYQQLRPQPTAEQNATVKRMRELIRELQAGDLSPAQKQAALEELIHDQRFILQQHHTWLDWQKPQTVDSAALLLEKMIFEEAAELAPTAQSRELVLRKAPQHLDLDPADAQSASRYEPPLLEPIVPRGKKIVAKPPEKAAEVPATAPAPEPARTPPQVATDADAKDLTIDKRVKVAVLADDATTADMHEDNTVLRSVTNDDGQLVLFGRVHLWLGGALQLDAYRGEGLFNLDQGGDSDSKSFVRRGEGILRASLFENSETKVQYDFDTREFRDLYWRILSKSTSHSLTIGNQKEPIGQDYQVGSKFTTALEPSAPTSAFYAFRSVGIRYNAWNTLKSGANPIRFWGDSSTFVTTSIGLFGEDIENSNDTDWAVSGRISLGGRKTQDSAFHLAASASYRHGEYERIAPRPGVQDVNRIVLARPESDTQTLLGMEGLFNRGSLHGQCELYYSDYSGGEVNARGWGGYGQVGWLFGGKQRSYHPNWGLWGAVIAKNAPAFEVFGRISYTYGNDDINSSNKLVLATFGGNWYYRGFRLGANLIYAETERDVSAQDDGHTFALRLQYLF